MLSALISNKIIDLITHQQRKQEGTWWKRLKARWLVAIRENGAISRWTNVIPPINVSNRPPGNTFKKKLIVSDIKATEIIFKQESDNLIIQNDCWVIEPASQTKIIILQVK